MSRILGEHNDNNSISLISAICLVPIGTYVHVRYYDNPNKVHIHKVESALNALEFMAELNKRYKHLLYVREIRPKETLVGLALELICI